MVDLAMSIFEFLIKFLVSWHPWHPQCLLEMKSETDWSNSSQCEFAFTPQAMKPWISSAKSLTRRAVQRPRLWSILYSIIETGLIYLGSLNPIPSSGMTFWVWRWSKYLIAIQNSALYCVIDDCSENGLSCLIDRQGRKLLKQRWRKIICLNCFSVLKDHPRCPQSFQSEKFLPPHPNDAIDWRPPAAALALMTQVMQKCIIE